MKHVLGGLGMALPGLAVVISLIAGTVVLLISVNMEKIAASFPSTN